MNKQMNELIEKCKQYRARHNLSMQAMAQRCGISTVTLFNFENKKLVPQELTVYKIKQVVDENVASD